MRDRPRQLNAPLPCTCSQRATVPGPILSHRRLQRALNSNSLCAVANRAACHPAQCPNNPSSVHLSPGAIIRTLVFYEHKMRCESPLYNSHNAQALRKTTFQSLSARVSGCQRVSALRKSLRLLYLTASSESSFTPSQGPLASRKHRQRAFHPRIGTHWLATIGLSKTSTTALATCYNGPSHKDSSNRLR